MISASKWFLWLCGLFWELHPAVGRSHMEHVRQGCAMWGCTLGIFLLFISSPIMQTPEGAAARIQVTAKAWQQIWPSHLTKGVLESEVLQSPCYHSWKCFGQVELFVFRRWCAWRVCTSAWDLSPVWVALMDICIYFQYTVLFCNTPFKMNSFYLWWRKVTWSMVPAQ